MGYYVHWLVCWSAGTPEQVSPIASVFKKEDMDIDAGWFLEQVINEKGYFPGPKGDLWAIGRIGNYSNGERILLDLKPFFKELYRRNILYDDERVILFQEAEQSEIPRIFQLDSTEKINEFMANGWYWGQY